MPEEVTTGRGYQKPHPANPLSQDVLRLRAFADQSDADMAAALSLLAGKADLIHSHGISDVSGLTSALAEKAGTSHSHALGGLADVTVTGAASGHFLKYVGPGWASAQIGISDVANLTSTLSSIQTALSTMDGGSY